MKDNTKPYEQAYFPARPNALTRFMRKNILWQFFRFIILNFKILKAVFKSH
jgi:hypothetical protein